jgi:hypothetical protein
MQTKLALAAENGRKSDLLQRGPRRFLGSVTNLSDDTEQGSGYS